MCVCVCVCGCVRECEVCVCVCVCVCEKVNERVALALMKVVEASDAQSHKAWTKSQSTHEDGHGDGVVRRLNFVLTFSQRVHTSCLGILIAHWPQRKKTTNFVSTHVVHVLTRDMQWPHEYHSSGVIFNH